MDGAADELCRNEEALDEDCMEAAPDAAALSVSAVVGGLVYLGDERFGLLGEMSMPNLRVDIPGDDDGLELLLLENRPRLLLLGALLPFLLGDIEVSVTSKPSCMMEPGTGRSGPTYRRNVSSTPVPAGVLDMLDATSSMVV